MSYFISIYISYHIHIHYAIGLFLNISHGTQIKLKTRVVLRMASKDSSSFFFGGYFLFSSNFLISAMIGVDNRAFCSGNPFLY